MTGTQLDNLYEAVQELVDAIYEWEGDILPPGTEGEAQEIAARIIRAAVAEGEAVSKAIHKFREEG